MTWFSIQLTREVLRKEPSQMSNEDLEPINRAIQARVHHLTPTPADLKFCTNRRWKSNLPPDHPDYLLCWNGKTPARPQCPFPGSQNIKPHAEAGLGNWEFFAALSRLWKSEGMGGLEQGSLQAYYSTVVIEDFKLAYRELMSSGQFSLAGGVKLAIRSYLAWDCVIAIPVERVKDELHTPEGVETGTIPKPVPRSRSKSSGIPLSVCPAGMRITPHRRGSGLTSDDVRPRMLLDAIRNPSVYGLSSIEAQTLESCTNGDIDSARTVSSWMFGSLHIPGRPTWKWRLRRFKDSAESVYLGDGPHSYKPCREVGQIKSNGTYTGVQSSVLGKKNWTQGHRVEIENGIITATSAEGSVSVPELTGELLWEVNVNGGEVKFT